MDVKVLERALERERARRARAEDLLEEKSRELYHSYAELERSQEQLIASEKMASLGVMAAGVAHEINNPVGFVRSNLNNLGEYAETLEQALRLALEVADGADPAAFKKLADEEDLDFVLEDLSHLVKESVDGLSRVTKIVGGLKTFSRASDTQWSAVDVNKEIESVLSIARTQVADTIQLHCDLGELHPIQGDATQVNQVLLNLVMNAADAVKEVDAPAVNISSSINTEEKMVLVVVQDNGCGMSQDTQTKLFQPFFTTKPVGEGTGLGLSISHGIVAEHGGDIGVQSTPGQGTTFTVQLPLPSPPAN